MTETKRIVWVDYAKFLCIYFVTLVHTPIYRPIYDIVCASLIPMFFFLSGYFFSYKKYPVFKSFVSIRWKQLMIPYFALAGLAYIFWFFVGRHYGDDANVETLWYSPLLGTILGYGKQMVQSVPLWFVMALFVLQILYWPIGKYTIKNQYILLIVITLISFLNIEYIKLPLPFEVNQAIAGMTFYILGMIARQILTEKALEKYSIAFLVIGILLVAIAVKYNVHVTFLILRFGNYGLFLLGAIGGILTTVSISFWLSKVFGENAFVKYIGRNTIVICGLHLIIFTLIKGVMVYIIDMPLSVLEQSVAPCMIFGFLSIIGCIPIIFLINRFCPVLVGHNLKH